MNSENPAQDRMVFFETFYDVIQKIRISAEVHADYTLLNIDPIYSIRYGTNLASLWEIEAHYDPISTMNPNTEIHIALCRLISKTQIQAQHLDDTFSIVAHYTQSLLLDGDPKKLFSYFHDLQLQLFEPEKVNFPELSHAKFDLEQCKWHLEQHTQQLQQHLLQHFTDPQLLSWYQLRYADFSPQEYFVFARETAPYRTHLQRWEQEHPNRCIWFLYWDNLEHIADPSYFSYEHLIQLQYCGVALFQNKGHIKHLFALPPKDFNQVMQTLFSPATEMAYAAQIILAVVTQPNRHYDIYYLRYIMPPASEGFYREFISQYIAVLILTLTYYERPQDSEYMHADSGLEDFIYGKQIHNNQYTDQPNIALIHPSATVKSLLRHNRMWHQKSLSLQASQHPFLFEAFCLDMHQCRFELIMNHQQLSQEADEMEHCILTFAERIQQGKYFAFRVFFNDFRGTLGLSYQSQNFSYFFDQVYGLRNDSAPDHIHKVCKAFAQYLTVEDIFFDNMMENCT